MKSRGRLGSLIGSVAIASLTVATSAAATPVTDEAELVTAQVTVAGMQFTPDDTASGTVGLRRLGRPTCPPDPNR